MTDVAAFDITLVPIGDLEPNPRNINQGDIGAVATAIAVDGWHLACLAQAPDKKRKKPRLVAGETRWRALSMLQVDGYTDPDGTHSTYAELSERVLLPPVGFVPVQLQTMDDLRATRKMLADNRASALATSDDAALVELLTELAADDSLFGSLFDGDDLDQLIAQLAAEPDFSEPPQGGERQPVVCPECGTEFVPERAGGGGN